MPDFLGADLGADVWQLAAKAAGESLPTACSFGGDMPGYPAVLLFDAAGQIKTGWDAHATRHEILSRTILWPNSPAGGQLQEKLAALRKTSAAEAQAAAQRTLLEQMLEYEPERSHRPLAVALPNLGTAPWQSLVTALSRSRWKTKLFVSDWAAALTSLGHNEYRSAHLLAIGAGETRWTSAELEQDSWRVRRRAEFPELSARQVHEKLAARLAAQAARQLHRDPLLRDRNYIAVRTVIDDCLCCLQTEPYVQQPVSLFESNYLYELSRGDVAAAAGSAVEGVRQCLLQAVAAEKNGKSLVLVRGMLAKILPLASWLPREVRPAVDFVLLEDDAIAQGASLWCEKYQAGFLSRDPEMAVGPEGNLVAAQLLRGEKLALPWFDTLAVEQIPAHGLGRHVILPATELPEAFAPTEGRLSQLEIALPASSPELDLAELDLAELSRATEPQLPEPDGSLLPTAEWQPLGDAAAEALPMVEFPEEQGSFLRQGAILGGVYLMIVALLSAQAPTSPTKQYGSFWGALLIAGLLGFAQSAIDRSRYFAVLLSAAGMVFVGDLLLQGELVRSFLPFSYFSVIPEWSPTAWSIVLLPLAAMILPIVNSGWTKRGRGQVLLLALSLPLIAFLSLLAARLVDTMFGPFGEIIGFWGSLLMLFLQWQPIVGAAVLLAKPAWQEQLLGYLRWLPGRVYWDVSQEAAGPQ